MGTSGVPSEGARNTATISSRRAAMAGVSFGAGWRCLTPSLQALATTYDQYQPKLRLVGVPTEREGNGTMSTTGQPATDAGNRGCEP